MAKKKRQHFVPQIYLKAFTDPSPPPDWPSSRPFEPTVWVAPALDLTGFRRKAPSNILARTRLYNLEADDPERPWLEEALGRIESSYERVRQRLEARGELSIEDYGTLLIFVGTLTGRTPKSLEHRQRFVDDLERIHRNMVKGHPEAVADADRIFRGSRDGGKHLLPAWTQAYAEVIAQEGFFVTNRSAMEFVTSDDPVCHAFLHSDEQPVSSFPEGRRVGVPRSQQKHFSFTPLTPRLAFVSSPLLHRGDDIYWDTADLALVFALNQLTRSMAVDWVIASSERPYGELTEALIEAEAELASAPRSGIRLYTEQDRYWIATSDAQMEGGAHPLVSRLRFSTSDMDTLRRVDSDGRIRELTVYEKGRASSHLKHARLVHVAESPSEQSVIETNLEDLSNAARTTKQSV